MKLNDFQSNSHYHNYNIYKDITKAFRHPDMSKTSVYFFMAARRENRLASSDRTLTRREHRRSQGAAYGGQISTWGAHGEQSSGGKICQEQGEGDGSVSSVTFDTS